MADLKLSITLDALLAGTAGAAQRKRLSPSFGDPSIRAIALNYRRFSIGQSQARPSPYC